MLLFPHVCSLYLAALRARPSYATYRRLFRQFFQDPQWNVPLRHLTRFQFMAFHQAHSTAPVHANRAIAFASQVFNWAQATINPETGHPYYEGENPCLGIKRYKVCPRQRPMRQVELVRLLDALTTFPPKYRAWFTCRLLVPCRIVELNRMRIADLSPDGCWTKGRTKNGHPQWTYVAIQAREALRTIPQRLGATYFFEGLSGRPLSSAAPRKFWAQWRRVFQLSDVRLLDFRHTLATFLFNECHADELTIKAVLNHYDPRPVAVYTKLSYDRLAAMLQAYADWVWSLQGLSPPIQERDIMPVPVGQLAHEIPARPPEGLEASTDRVQVISASSFLNR